MLTSKKVIFKLFCALWPSDLASLTIGDRSILMVLITVGEKKNNQIPFWSWNGSKVEHTFPAKGDLFGACVVLFFFHARFWFAILETPQRSIYWLCPYIYNTF